MDLEEALQKAADLERQLDHERTLRLCAEEKLREWEAWASPEWTGPGAPAKREA